MSPIEIQPASLTQVVNYRGKKVAIERDVTDVARQLREISPQLRLFFMEDADPPHFQVEQHITERDGSVTEQLVLTSMDLGSHIVERVKLVTSERYNLADEVERIDAAKRKAQDHDFEEKIGERAEQIAWAVRKDLGVKRNF